MPLEIPNLDDRTFADLVEEGIAMIPRYAPEWTNHNASDPGITLVELLAYFTELMIYRLDRISRENRIRFLELLRGSDWEGAERLRDAPEEALEAEWRRAVLELWEPQRAVTAEDFEHLARRILREETGGAAVVRCLMNSNLTVEPQDGDHPGHVSLVVLFPSGTDPEDAARLRSELKTRLEPMRLLTVRLHVVPPTTLFGAVHFRVSPRPGFSHGEARRAAILALKRRFELGSGVEENEVLLGRSLYISELIDLLERVPEVDAVAGVRLSRVSPDLESLHEAGAALGIQLGLHSTLGRDARLGVHPRLGRKRLLRNEAGELIGFALRPHELLRVVEAEVDRVPAGEDQGVWRL